MDSDLGSSTLKRRRIEDEDEGGSPSIIRGESDLPDSSPSDTYISRIVVAGEGVVVHSESHKEHCLGEHKKEETEQREHDAQEHEDHSPGSPRSSSTVKLRVPRQKEGSTSSLHLSTSHSPRNCGETCMHLQSAEHLIVTSLKTRLEITHAGFPLLSSTGDRLLIEWLEAAAELLPPAMTHTRTLPGIGAIGSSRPDRKFLCVNDRATVIAEARGVVSVFENPDRAKIGRSYQAQDHGKADTAGVVCVGGSVWVATNDELVEYVF